MQWYVDHALRLATTTFIKDFLCELRANVVVSTRILTNLLNVVPNSMVTCFNNSKYADI